MNRVGPAGGIRALSAHFEEFAFTRHEHDHFVIGMIGAGLQTFELGPRSYVTPPGYLMLINPGEPHTGRAAREEGFTYLALYPGMEDLLRFQESADLRPCGTLSFRNTHVLDELVHGRLWNSVMAASGDPLAQETVFVHTMRELLRRHATCESRSTAPSLARLELRRTRDYLQAHSESRITLADLAQVAGLSPYHLSRLFAEAFGLPPHKYLEGVRVRQAQGVLASGLPLAEVALAAGFSSQSHLNRSFKLAVVVLGELPAWQKLNVVAFTASGVAVSRPDITGEPYEDGSGNSYLPMFRQPVLVFEADPAGIRKAYDRAMERELRPAIFTRELFETGHDEANRKAVKARTREELELVGFALHGDRNLVDKVVKGLKLHA